MGTYSVSDISDIFDLGEALLSLSRDHAAWSQKTFGSDADRGPIGALKHLAKEAVEAQDSPGDSSEYADCLLLLLDASRRAGFSPLALIRCAQNKMQANKARDWPAPLADEPVEHVRHDDIDPANPIMKWVARDLDGWLGFYECEPVSDDNGNFFAVSSSEVVGGTEISHLLPGLDTGDARLIRQVALPDLKLMIGQGVAPIMEDVLCRRFRLCFVVKASSSSTKWRRAARGF